MLGDRSAERGRKEGGKKEGKETYMGGEKRTVCQKKERKENAEMKEKMKEGRKETRK